MQALMLAAGMGKRLGKFTKGNTKCMVEVAGKKLIDRAIEAIKYAGINKFIIVVGYQGDNLMRYILEKYKDSGIEFVFIMNKDYDKSNNIYSFYMARNYLEQDDTIMLESDLIFDKSLIKKVKDSEYKTLAVVAKYESWMDGTVVTCDENDTIVDFIDKSEMNFNELDKYYKTVNIYKLSSDFAKNVYIPFLEAYIKSCGLNNYYETVLKVITHLHKVGVKALYMDDMPWYEIDDAQDLDISNVLFSHGKEKYDLITSKFGGYWRYNHIIDFCYLVNPYFPPKNMVAKMQNEFPNLLTKYPSGLNIQNMNAERVFGVDERHILIGNGAAELINILGIYAKGKVAVGLPTFNEYVRCFRNSEIVEIDNSQWGYRHNLEYIKNLIPEVDYMCLINPDNPSGYLLNKQEIISLCDIAKENDTILIVDESFIDFAAKEKRYTLLDNDILDKYNNLIVIKSISKSYGVPALRLGVLASSNEKIIKEIRNLMQVWNINSFAEYYLQIYNLYAKTYENACNKIVDERNRFINELCKIKGIKVYPSEANYIMIDLGKINSYDFCVKMLDKNNLLVKNLSTKHFFENKNFIRVAIRDEKDNNIFINAFKEEMK